MSMFTDQIPSATSDIARTRSYVVTGASPGENCTVRWNGKDVAAVVVGRKLVAGDLASFVRRGKRAFAMHSLGGYDSSDAVKLCDLGESRRYSIAIRMLMNGNPKFRKYRIGKVTQIYDGGTIAKVMIDDATEVTAMVKFGSEPGSRLSVGDVTLVSYRRKGFSVHAIGNLPAGQFVVSPYVPFHTPPLPGLEPGDWYPYDAWAMFNWVELHELPYFWAGRVYLTEMSFTVREPCASLTVFAFDGHCVYNNATITSASTPTDITVSGGPASLNGTHTATVTNEGQYAHFYNPVTCYIDVKKLVIPFEIAAEDLEGGPITVTVSGPYYLMGELIDGAPADIEALNNTELYTGRPAITLS